MRLCQWIVVNALALVPVLASENVPQPKPSAVADLLQAVELEHQGRNTEAKVLLLNLVRRLEPGSGEVAVALGIALNDLAAISQTEGQFAEAEAGYNRAIRTLAPEMSVAGRAAWAYSKFNLARLYLESGRIAQAERLSLPDALDAIPDVESRMRAESTLAGMAALRNDFAKAEDTYLRMLSLWRDPERIVKNQVEIASLLNNLAVIAIWRGNKQRANERMTESLAIWSALDSPNDTAAARVMAATGVVCTLLKRYDDAVYMLSRASATGRARYGESHPLTVAIELSYVQALNKAGRKSEAREMAGIAEQGRKAGGRTYGNYTVDYRDLMTLGLRNTR